MALLPWLAATAAHGAGSMHARNLAATCTACHVKGGAGAAAMRPLDGTDAARLRSALLAYKSGQRPGSVMPQLARGYSDAEISEIAAWFAAQQP
ncbi:MAG: c-type cytochrome [Casimicrobiaceae bacterium]